MALPEDHDPNVIAVCTECRTNARPQYLYSHPLGADAPCKYCGGVLLVTRVEDREHSLDKSAKNRGI